MILLVDIGNSRLKWALAEADLIRNVVAVDYREPGFSEKLREYWSGIPFASQLALASVSANELTEWLIDLAITLWPSIEIIQPRPTSTAFGVTNAYARPETLGVDRWLALLAAHRHYPGDACIVNCGTAITIDFISRDGLHAGGLIGPGLRLMRRSLAANTAALPFSDIQADMCLATVTEAAINNGTLLAAVGTVEAIMSRQAQSYRLIFSGGDADAIVRHLSRPAIVDNSLILKGLLNYCRVAESQ